MVYQSLLAIKELPDVSVELIDLRSIRPLDIDTIIESVKKTNRVVVIEEGHYFAGICAELCYQIQAACFDYLDAPMIRVTQRETPMPYSKPLEAETLPNKERIKKAINQVL